MKKYIGGSDIAAICGQNKYKTPFQVWEQFQGEVAQATSHTSAGDLLEPVIIAKFEQDTGLAVVNRQAKFVDGFKIAIVDGMVAGALLSVKNTSQEVDLFALPDYWTSQLNWEMGLSGIHSGYITWLSRGYEFGRAKFEFDSELFDWQVAIADEFYFEYVTKGVPPPPINSFEIVQRINSTAMPKELTNAELYKKIGVLKNLQVALKETEKEIDEIKEEIKMYLVECDTLTFSDKVLATWKQSKDGFELDKKEFESAYPDLYQSLLKPKKGNRVLLIK